MAAEKRSAATALFCGQEMWSGNPATSLVSGLIDGMAAIIS
ncbi:hypothetical protein UYSO10_2457 [Kosakonia radicincitans]|nr:hypothetical protein UYSO10_2457 [Kosakonia radicincitans]